MKKRTFKTEMKLNLAEPKLNKNKKDACGWLEDFKKSLTSNIKAKVVRCKK